MRLEVGVDHPHAEPAGLPDQPKLSVVHAFCHRRVGAHCGAVLAPAVARLLRDSRAVLGDLQLHRVGGELERLAGGGEQLGDNLKERELAELCSAARRPEARMVQRSERQAPLCRLERSRPRRRLLRVRVGWQPAGRRRRLPGRRKRVELHGAPWCSRSRTCDSGYLLSDLPSAWPISYASKAAAESDQSSSHRAPPPQLSHRRRFTRVSSVIPGRRRCSTVHSRSKPEDELRPRAAQHCPRPATPQPTVCDSAVRPLAGQELQRAGGCNLLPQGVEFTSPRRGRRWSGSLFF